jgi:hypothetical protein
MAGLNGIFVEEEHVALANPTHLKRLVPREERIQLRPLGLKVAWRA